MNIQTLSIVVPTKGCVNHCPFCVSRMHDCPYENTFDKVQIEKRIKYAVMNGVNTCIITGTGEALQNYHFLGRLADIFREMNNPFPNVELQTTGVMLQDFDDKIHASTGRPYAGYYNVGILKELGVNTISLSISDIFFDKLNMDIIGVNEKLRFKLDELIPFLKQNGFNIRLSLNMLKHFDDVTPAGILRRCKELGANQVTFRKMYYDLDKDNFAITTEAKWTKENKCSDETLVRLKEYIEGQHYTNVAGNKKDYPGKGTFLYKLPFGGKVYSIEGMSTVMDDDCMSKENNDSLKYIVLRENGKLYCRWDDEGSLIF